MTPAAYKHKKCPKAGTLRAIIIVSFFGLIVKRIFRGEKMEIAVENMKYLHNAGNLRAFCDVRIRTADGDWVIRSCKIIQQPKQKAWLSFPTISWQDGDGKTYYKTMLEVPTDLKSKISEASLSTYYETQTKAA